MILGICIMAPRKRSSTKNNIPRTAVEQALEVLKELPEKPKEELSLGEAVELGREQILAALKEKNYSHEEIAATLSEHGLEITPSSLRYYLTRGRKKQEGSSKPTRSRTTRRASRGRKSSAGVSSPSTTTEETSTAPAEAVETLAVETAETTPESTVASTPSEPTTDLSGSLRRSARSTSKGRGRTAAKRKTTATSKTRTSPGRTLGRGRTSTRKSKKASSKTSSEDA